MPIFLLNTVVFPGQTVPLHIFEQRYRDLVTELLGQPAPEERLFAIVAIREGYEVGGAEAGMYSVGTAVQLTQVERYEDGRFDIATVGRQRVQVVSVDRSRAFLHGEIEFLDQTPPAGLEPDEVTAQATARALAGFLDYRRRLVRMRGDDFLEGSLPRDPELLAFALSGVCPLPLPDRQRLLEAATTTDRLALLRRLLRDEVRAMTAIPSLPASELARTGWYPN